jgi:hypothetical protein
MSLWLLPQIAFTIGWTAGYVFWSRVYYRSVDPLLRMLIGAWLGVRISWVYRHGTQGVPLRFGPRYAMWTWGTTDPQARGIGRESLVYLIYIIVVPLLCGLWPVALLLLIMVGTRWLHPLVVLPLVFLVIPIYSIYWTGRYQVAGMIGEPREGS